MPYTAPTSADVHFSRPLTNFAMKYLQDANMFVALRAMPNLPVQKEFDRYYIFARSDFFRNEVEIRADGTESAAGSFDTSTEPYQCDVRALHKLVTDRQRANEDEAINLDQSTVQYLMLQMLMAREIDFQTTFMGASIWGTDFTPTVKWTADNANPITEIETAIETVQGNTGYRPNKMVLGRLSWNAIKHSDDFLARITGGSTTGDPARVMPTHLAQILEIDNVYIMEAVTNSANRGATESTNFIVGDNALVYYAPDTVGIDTVSAGVTFSWNNYLQGATDNGTAISRFREDGKRADKIEAEMAFDHKVTASELGYFFQDTNA